ncbi:SNF2-related protein (plasmid) [Kitasatospora griseola]|uniref:SNF2-related protein n=1 Tax=Kitasatospora griseola TaxID=2064 RepID=UPI003855B6E3
MPEKAFSVALQKSIETGRRDPLMVRESVRRAKAGRVPVRDAQALLLCTGDQAWQAAREAVLQWLTNRPEFASAVLATHTQLVMKPPARAVAEGSGPNGFFCRAAVDLPDGTVEGPVTWGSKRKPTRQQAMLALVAQLAGMDLPASEELPSPGPEQIVDAIPQGPLVTTRWDGLGRDRFSDALRELVVSGAPERDLLQELDDRALDGRVSPKDWLVILTRGGPSWEKAKALALRVIDEVPGLAAHVMNMLRQQTGAPPVEFSEERLGPDHGPEFEVVASMATENGPVSGQPQRAGARKTARDRAVTSLMAVIAGMPDPPAAGEQLEALPRALRRPAGANPLTTLNGVVVAGLASRPVYDFDIAQGVHRCRVRTLVDGRVVEAVASASTKQEAKSASATRLLMRLRGAYLDPDSAPAVPEAPVPALPGSAVRAPAGGAVPAPRAEPSTPSPDWASARDAIGWALASGCALLFHPACPDHLLVYRADGSPVHSAAPPAPLAPAEADVVLQMPTGGPWRTTVQAWAAPLPVLLPFLAAPEPTAHPAVLGWAGVVRLALRVVAAGAVVPSIDHAGRDRWRPAPCTALDVELARAAAALPPFAHAVTAAAGPLRIRPPLPAAGSVLDDLVDLLVRGPGAALLHGDGAFASPPRLQNPNVQQWADAVERNLDPCPEPELILAVQAPGPDGPLHRDGEPVLAARLTFRDDSAPAARQGRGTRRVLRRGAAVWPPLTRLAHARLSDVLELSVGEAAELLGSAAEELEDAGIQLRWPPELADALGSYTVVGTGSAHADDRGLTMEAMLDWRWQLTIDDCDLTDAEMDELAEAARPLVRLRDRWILTDPLQLARARSRHLGQLPTREALTSALAGSLLVDGALVACRPAGGLAAIVTALRSGDTASPPVPPPPGLTARLRPYQQRGYQWLVQLFGLHLNPLLADDMGLGKTLVTLAAVLHRRQATSRPVLVVCPTSLLDVWEQQAAAFAPSLRVLRHHGQGRTLPPDLSAGAVVVTTYGTLVRDVEQLGRHHWDLVVADEAHTVNSGTSQASIAIRTLTADARLGVTGTPVENRSEEMWALQDWLNPGLLGSRAAFRARIGRHTARDADGDAAYLLRRITGPFVLRRLKTDPEIAPDLPAKVQALHPVSLSTEQAALYEALVRETVEDLRGRPRAARQGRVLALLQDLRKIVNDPALYLGEQVDAVAADLAAARSRSAKLDVLLDLVAEARTAGEQILVCVNYLPIGNLLTACLNAAGHRAEFFQGSTPPKARTRMVDDFQAGRLPVLVLSVRAGGTGLTLTAATEVIHYDSPWTSTARDQASDRAFRIGQTRTVHVRHLVARGTVEERIEKVVTHKSTLADAVLPAGEHAFADMDEMDLTALVTLAGQS